MIQVVAAADKPVVWLAGEIKTPPFSQDARIEAGFLLRRLQRGETLGMPHVRAMPPLGRRCFELRVRDQRQTWRIMLRLDADAVVIAGVFAKTTRTTPRNVLDACRERLRRYDEAVQGEGT
jgi:phage-related protein